MKKLTKTITIGVTDSNECGVSVSPDMDCALALQLLGTLASHILNAYKAVAIDSISANSSTSKLSKKDKDAAIQGITESMYDAADSIFSTVLTQFYPDAARNSIEDEAILRLTNELIEKRYNSLPESERKAFSTAYNKTKLSMQMRPTNSSHSQPETHDN